MIVNLSIRGNPLFRARPAHSSRDLRVLPPMATGGAAVDRVYLLAPESQSQALATKYGINSNKHGAFFNLDDDVSLARIHPGMLPFFARPQVAPFICDLAPANSWGSSLAALLSSTSLLPVASASSQKFGHKCYLCGAPQASAKAPAHHARPWWGYGSPVDGEAFARQHLMALTPMCIDCADMLQLGRPTETARLQALLRRLGTVFRFTDAETRQYHELALQRWEKHSGYLWAADLSRVFSGVTVELQAAWQHSVDPGQSDPILYRSGGATGRPASFQLRGVRYRLSGHHRIHLHP